MSCRTQLNKPVWTGHKFVSYDLMKALIPSFVEGAMYDVAPREDEESSSGSYDDTDDGNPSRPTSSSFQFASPAQNAVNEVALESVRASEAGLVQPEPSTSTSRLRPSLAPLSHSARLSVPGSSSMLSGVPGLPPRTPGVSMVRGDNLH